MCSAANVDPLSSRHRVPPIKSMARQAGWLMWHEYNVLRLSTQTLNASRFGCRCSMKGRVLGAAAISFLLLCVLFLGSTKSSHNGSSQDQVRATRRTLIGRQEEVELLDSEVIQQETEGGSQEESFYMPWIQQDFAVWEEEGIKQVRRAMPFFRASA